MNQVKPQTVTAFWGNRRLAGGALSAVIGAVKRVVDSDQTAAILIFDDETSRLVEFDWRGTVDDVVARVPPEAEEKRAGPGRPKLGVVSREISLLPRHWDWLATQPGGASVTVRRLVDEARKALSGRDRVRQVQESTYRFMNAMAGNLPDYEEALRALYAQDGAAFYRRIAAWPDDLRSHITKLSSPLFSSTPPKDGDAP